MISEAETARLADTGELAAAVIALPTTPAEWLSDRSWALLAVEIEALAARARWKRRARRP